MTKLEKYNDMLIKIKKFKDVSLSHNKKEYHVKIENDINELLNSIKFSYENDNDEKFNKKYFNSINVIDDYLKTINNICRSCNIENTGSPCMFCNGGNKNVH